MSAFNPAEDDDEGHGTVAPLVQFFELVHVGDTIGQIIQVFFDKEMVGIFQTRMVVSYPRLTHCC